jgi:hypothetical protein
MHKPAYRLQNVEGVDAILLFSPDNSKLGKPRPAPPVDLGDV